MKPNIFTVGRKNRIIGKRGKDIIPQLIVREEALENMKQETLKYPHIETAWGNYGFILPENKVYLAGIIPPPEEDIVRGFGHTTFGGKRVEAADIWLEKRAIQLGINPEKARYTYLYQGHSHHTLGLFDYSGIDIHSIRKVIESGDLTVAIGPLSIIRGAMSRVKAPTDLSAVDIKFYCYTHNMYQRGMRYPIEVAYQLVDDLPGIPVPKLGWQFFQRYDSELALLKAHGCKVTVQEKESFIRFVLTKHDWKGGMIIIETPCNYPKSRPVIKAIPKDDTDITDKSHHWRRKRHFSEIVYIIEKEVFTHGIV